MPAAPAPTPVTRSLVAAHYVWDEYPGVRVGRLVSGQADLGRHPGGETHAVSDADAVRTVCGLPRASFPHTFAVSASLRHSVPCERCGVVRAP